MRWIALRAEQRSGCHMKSLKAKVVSVHAGTRGELAKPACPCIQVELDGIVGDRHRSFVRETWLGDKQPKGTYRRNERQWSAVSIEELAAISSQMDLSEPLQASDLGANLCLSGVVALSRLPRGTILKFPSGAALIVEEYNPPCADMGESLGNKYLTRSRKPASAKAFCKAARLTRCSFGNYHGNTFAANGQAEKVTDLAQSVRGAGRTQMEGNA
jgi:MOSC domain-containing protein YiiM